MIQCQQKAQNKPRGQSKIIANNFDRKSELKKEEKFEKENRSPTPSFKPEENRSPTPSFSAWEEDCKKSLSGYSTQRNSSVGMFEAGIHASTLTNQIACACGIRDILVDLDKRSHSSTNFRSINSSVVWKESHDPRLIDKSGCFVRSPSLNETISSNQLRKALLESSFSTMNVIFEKCLIYKYTKL
jgi:hypothetical protein